MDAVINSKHPRRFFEDVSEIVLEHVHSVMQHGNAHRESSYPHYTVLNLAGIEFSMRLVRSQITRNKNRKYFCDSSNAKLEIHSKDCGKLNGCAIRLPSEAKISGCFDNHCRKERVPFVVYMADFTRDDRQKFNSATDLFPITKEKYYISRLLYVDSTKIDLSMVLWTLGEYSDLYLKTDVLLLVDIFENFRDSCVASYGLDPTYYYILYASRIYRAIRGGLNQCSNRYARANNKYMSSYDPWKPSSYNFEFMTIALDLTTFEKNLYNLYTYLLINNEVFYTSTDCFIFHIKCDDVYDIMKSATEGKNSRPPDKPYKRSSGAYILDTEPVEKLPRHPALVRGN
ncbi:hypothetical protein ALC56_03018 [Trachymyrmex septentrionalis]|uniref:Uncharacterized protein n=1 Tax=Trachymyrmex septentrionalis TaxID=34720 RepID=A0A151K0K9_9HYME|nr:hypothetical protein ALC56_03018 [Trachymyrmex septentrionalis]